MKIVFFWGKYLKWQCWPTVQGMCEIAEKHADVLDVRESQSEQLMWLVAAAAAAARCCCLLLVLVVGGAAAACCCLLLLLVLLLVLVVVLLPLLLDQPNPPSPAFAVMMLPIIAIITPLWVFICQKT